ncbi:hypothetical protein QE390_003236 [Siphonobacter sp. SORGH_AS 1065]|nr:hypothetical protein [Siphonobacter sp. SORGH_AS_1065]
MPLPAEKLAAIGLILYGMRLDLKSLLPAFPLAAATMLEDAV